MWDGIEDKRFDVGLIEWNEIAYILLAEMRHASLISLILNSPEKYHRRLSKVELLLRKLNGQKRIDDFRVRFALLDTPIEEAWQFIGENVIKPREERGIHLMP